MKKKFYSFVSMFLVICMVMSSIPVYAFTEPESKLDTPETNAENKVTITNPEFNAASSSKVLDYVDKAEFESHKFIGRVTEEEELNSYVFQNEDGSRTAYFFSENVKYVDKDGIVQEKDISLVATRSGYTTTKNEVSVNFSSSPSNGITMGYGEHTVTLKPIFTTKGVTASKKDNAIEYVGLFSSNATLKYTPLLSGIKEDIVLSKYTGINEYSFTLTTNGLGIYESENGYFLAESKATKAIFYLGDVIAYDANNVPHEGALSVKTVKENQEYTLTVSVDEEFLTDKNTVYPVTIDPTITISDTASGAGAIQDAPIFSARPSSNHGTYEYDRVGTPSADFGVGRTVVRLYGLINSSTYANLTANRITNVKFYAKEATGSATQTIKVYPLTNTSWTESGVTWNNVGSWSTTAICSVDMAYAQLTAFDITSLVKGWKNGTYAANAGFIMMSANESANKCFVSSEHTDTSRRPYVSMSYTAAISLNKSSVSIGEGSTTTLTATTNPSGTAVTWSSTTPSVATVSSSGVVTAVKAGKATIKASMTTGGTTYTANCTVYVTIEDGVYYIQNQNSNKYLTTDGTVTGSPNVIQLSKYTEAGNSDAVRIRQMWKIKYLRDGQYSIRPMNKLDMGLDVTGMNVDTYTIGTQDQLDNIIETARWSITKDDTGIRLSMQGFVGYTLQVQGDSTTNNAEIIADDYADSDSIYWNLIEVANPPSGVYWYDTGKGAIATNITRAISVGESKSLTNLQLIPVAYSGTNISQSFTWSTSNTSVATVNSSGTVTGVSSGIATITGYVYRNSTYYYLSYSVCVGFPSLFNSLINSNIIDADKLDLTDDGLFLTTKSISSILSQKGISQLPTNSDYTSSWNVSDFFDDWYLFAVENNSSISYGMYKMREQEHDHNDGAADGDAPGVTISFISLDASKLTNCLNNTTNANKYELYIALIRTAGPDPYAIDATITDYFARAESDGAYLIAEKSVEFFANSVSGNIIGPSNLLEGLFEHLDSLPPLSLQRAFFQRIPDALENINNSAEPSIFDSENHTITVQDKNNLSLYEKQAILTCFSANVTFNSFAAEVVYHAVMARDYPNIDDIQKSACRADMAIELEYNLFESYPYYDLTNDYVLDQIEAHGEY